MNLSSVSQSSQELAKTISTGVGDLANPVSLATNIDRATKTSLHALGGLGTLMRSSSGSLRVVLSEESLAEGHKSINQGSVTRLRGGVAAQRGDGVLDGLSPDLGVGLQGRASVLVAETVGQGVQEDGVDSARSTVHDFLDNADDAVDGRDNVVVQWWGWVVEKFLDGFGTTLQTDTAVAVTDKSVEAGDFGLGLDDGL